MPGLRPSSAAAAATPASYLAAAQNADGGYGAAPGTGSDPLFSGWAALGLAAAGVNPADQSRDGTSLLTYLERGAASLPDVGAVERTILAGAAAGADPRAFGGQDLVATLERHLRPDGSVADQVNLTAFAVLALRAAGAPVSGQTLDWLAAQQDGDGGFNFSVAGGASDADDTGAALEALGPRPGTVGRALRFLRAAENPDGGFPGTPGEESNAQSTAFVVQGLIAAGIAPGALHRGGATALGFLSSLIAPDGHVRYSPSTDQTPVWVTAQALLALAGRPFPLTAVTRVGTGAGVRSAAGRHARSGRSTGPHPRSRARRRAAVAGQTAGGRSLGPLAAAAGLLAAVAYAPVGL